MTAAAYLSGTGVFCPLNESALQFAEVLELPAPELRPNQEKKLTMAPNVR